MSTQLVTVENTHNQLTFAPPQQLVSQAVEIANELKRIIKEQELIVTFGGSGEHVLVEGWSTMAAMLGVIAREKSVTKHADGTWEAFVDLVSLKTGAVIGGASSIVGMDEKSWASKPDFSRRSMAITRATGKAFRLAFSWVMTLAGYKTTPAEDMPGYEPGMKVGPDPKTFEVSQPSDAFDDLTAPVQRENVEAFGDFKPTFGKHVGRKLRDIPDPELAGYVEWLVGNQTESKPMSPAAKELVVAANRWLSRQK